jgi:hypothetical protein
MADIISIALKDIYKELFGVTGKLLKDFAGQAGGQNYLCPITISYAGDRVYNPDSWTMPQEPLVSARRSNVIIRNPILKNSDTGTVKELWSAGDWELEIKGVVFGDDPTKLPEAEINRLRWFAEVKRAIKVKSPFFVLLGVEWMVIESIEFPETRGYNYQAYVIKAFSDKPFEL